MRMNQTIARTYAAPTDYEKWIAQIKKEYGIRNSITLRAILLNIATSQGMPVTIRRQHFVTYLTDCCIYNLATDWRNRDKIIHAFVASLRMMNKGFREVNVDSECGIY